MPFCISDLTAESIEDATAYWLFSEDEGWDRWRLVPGSPAISPNRQVLRLAFEADGETFELVLAQRQSRLFARYDDHEDPEQEFLVREFESDGEVLLVFVHKDQTVFVHLELAV
jgi:hypothetical protein